MPCFLFILYSHKRHKFYVGVASDLDDKLKHHSNGQSISAKIGVPWKLIHSFICNDKSAAMIMEKQIKNRGMYPTHDGLVSFILRRTLFVQLNDNRKPSSALVVHRWF